MTSSKDFMDEAERRDFERARARGYLESLRAAFAWMNPEKKKQLKRALLAREKD